MKFVLIALLLIAPALQAEEPSITAVPAAAESQSGCDALVAVGNAVTRYLVAFRRGMVPLQEAVSGGRMMTGHLALPLVIIRCGERQRQAATRSR